MKKENLSLEEMLMNGYSLQQKGDYYQAQIIYQQILNFQPNHFDALQLSGAIALITKCNEQAVEFLSRAIKVSAHHAPTFYNLAIAFQSCKQPKEAVENFNQAINLRPNYFLAYCNRGNAFLDLEKLEAAIADYDQAIQLKPDYAQAYCNRGNALLRLKKFEKALGDYDAAIQLKPDFDVAFSNRGIALKELDRKDEALASFEKAVLINPDYSEAYNNLGNMLKELDRQDEAIACYNQALSINKDFAEPYNNLGCAFNDLAYYEEALLNFKHYIELKPINELNLDIYISTKMHLCDWENLSTDLNTLKKLSQEDQNQETKFDPFTLLFLIDDPQIHKLHASNFLKNKFNSRKKLPSSEKYPKHSKIRIGYFSGDFRAHAVSFLTAELYELHSRDQFEIFAFSIGPHTNDDLRKRLESGFDQFIDVQDKSDLEIAMLAREMQIDICVDLSGYTRHCRTGIFAARAAPIQLSYIGYLGTMGTDYHDYLIADRTIIPTDYQKHYSEKIIYLPSYQVNDTKRQVSEKLFTRAELGLPDNGFVFCCFNNTYKITPNTFDSWMRILLAVEDSILFLLDSNEKATKNLKKEAKKRGVNSNRLVFAKHLPLPEYLARYRVANLFLDTFPYNAGTTGSDALRMGLPLLTLIGESFASRMAASLLNAVGLPELITTNQRAYESLAIELATNQQNLEFIRNKLANNLPTCLLYNTKLFTQHIESAYQAIYQRYQKDLAPDHIYLENF